MKTNKLPLILIGLALGVATQSSATTPPTAFDCTGLAYQVARPNGGNATLYSYDVATSSRTSLGTLDGQVNAIAYYSGDNFIYGYDQNSNKVVKIGSNAELISYTINNLPANAFHIGAMIGDGYLLLYNSTGTKYYVVDIKEGRSTFKKMVDPTAGFVEATSPYGTTISHTMRTSDLAFDPTSQKLYGLIEPADSSHALKVATFDPTTAGVTFSDNAATGAGIETSNYFGSAFIYNTENKLYVFANGSGKFFQININNSPTATLLATFAPADHTDGASCPFSALPIKLIGFEANAQNNTAALEWQTASEQNSRGFGIEKSTNGVDWHNIGFVNSQAENGHSNALLSYTYSDLQPSTGQNYYRLRQEDKDGSHTYSTVRMLNFKNMASTAVTPNPTKGLLSISGLSKTKNHIIVANSIGQEVIVKMVEGQDNFTLDLSKLAPGVYYVQVIDSEGNATNHKAIKN